MFKYLNIALAGFWVAMMVSCTSMKLSEPSPMEPPQRAQRSYANIKAIKLYPLLENILNKEGLNIADRDYSRGYFRTEWFEYEGQRHGLTIWKERKRYSALFDVDRLSGKHLLVLELQIQERAPLSSDWREKEVDSYEYSQYQRILNELDEAVRNSGGILV